MKGKIIGGGNWSQATYNVATKTKVDKGTTFAYTRKAKRTGNVHETLDVTKPNSNGDYVRESRDSDDHPNAFPIAVFFDVTGSMREGPRIAVEKLPALYGTLLRKGYVEDPQILFGAIGDAISDQLPVQVGQFESDNRADEQLDNIALEGGGGGGGTESYEVTAFYMAHAAELDSLEKRGEKGLMFIVGDERNKPALYRDSVQKYLGDHFVGLMEDPETDMSVERVYELLQEKFVVYYLLPNCSGYYNNPAHIQHWKSLLGDDHAFKLEDISAVTEMISMLVGIEKGTITADQVAMDLREEDTSDETAIEVAYNAVTSVIPGGDPDKDVEVSKTTAAGPADLL